MISRGVSDDSSSGVGDSYHDHDNIIVALIEAMVVMAVVGVLLIIFS